MLFLESESSKPINALAFSPDGMRLLVGGGKVQIWDAFGGVINKLSDFPDFDSVAWSPSGSICAYSRHLYTWFRKLDEELSVDLEMKGVSVDAHTTQEFLTEDILVIGKGSPTSTGTGFLQLHYLLKQKKDPAPHLETAGVRAVAVHRPSNTVAWTTGQSMLKIWKIDRPDIKEIPLKKTAAKVAFAPNGEAVAVTQDWAARSFDVKTKHPLQTFTGHKGKITGLAYSPDGRTLVTGSWDETVRIWDAATAKEIRAFAWKIGEITALSYAPDGTRIAAASATGKIVIWDVD